MDLPELPSQYSRIFDAKSWKWESNPEIANLVLRAQENYFNHLLQTCGHVFLNDVYDALGLEKSAAGQFVGWIMASDEDGYVGDGYIDFGIKDPEKTSRFDVDGRFVLNFNVDGVIFDKINWKGKEGE